MFLKRLTCFGFKSFADKTDFDFEPGVTGIVGPNGCGKSNVVDAIKWVLGDQSARSLRGKQMLDVIFNGSGTRKNSNMAQVDLVFDNTDRKLNLETDEVMITRRLYRSGESEYLINNETVRLRDIRELFMDTGVGVGAYSIIEQGRVDVLLQANPTERRLIFEEAAGISRYKARKKEAERKLARVDQNLLRIEDIVEEVEKRLRSIKYQAGKARNFQVYDQQLREKRSTYSMAEYHRLTGKQADLRAAADGFEDEIAGLRTSISSSDTRTAKLDAELLELEGEIERIEQRILSNASEITANTERIDQSRQRIDELVSVRSRSQRRLAAEQRRVARLKQQIATEEQAAESLQSDLDEARGTVEALTAQDGEMARELNALRSQSEDEKAGIIELMRRTSQIHNEIQSFRQRQQHFESERDRLRKRQEQIRGELEQLLESKTQIDRRAEEITDQLNRQTEQLEEKKRYATRLDADRAELNNQLSAAKEYRSGLLSRRQILTDLERQLEGVDAGVRELLHRKEQDPSGQTFGYVRGMVADLITVDVAHAMLIETALGEYDQYLVVDDAESFARDADQFADFPGRVHALCLDLFPPFVNGRDYTQQEGFVAYAMDLIRFPEEARQMVQHLLGKTIVVRTLQDAFRMARENPPSYRYVTLSGELLEPQRGQCELGPAGGRTGLISRKSELREIDAQIDEVDTRIAEMSERLDETTAEIHHLESVQSELRSKLHETGKTEVENNAARNANANAIHRLQQEEPLIESEIASLDMQIDESQQRCRQSEETLSRLERESADREEHVRRLDEQLIEMGHRRSGLAERLTEARVTVGQLAQRRSLMAETLRGLRESQETSEEAVSASSREARDSHHRIQQTERTVLTAQSRLADSYAAKEQLDTSILARQHRREEIRFEIEQISARERVDRTALDEVEEKLHRVQMELQEVRIRVEDLVTRIREELDIDLAEAYANYEHAEDQNWEALEAEIEDLKGKIKRLGNVNLDAIAEQEELEKREAFLGGQRDDLRTSQKQLSELIEQLNQECRDRFTETFEAVRQHFQELYRKLFGGGRADIMLEQPPEGQTLDVLEAGIDIQARPPGKEPQNISLLSGGEKTMTAIALLLAIFRSRPSPFAILDEVDAALDEANNERFNRIVGEFLNHSQFIVITHSKRTMTIADVLYGVTMQEAGVSKRVSVKFDSTDDDQTAAA